MDRLLQTSLRPLHYVLIHSVRYQYSKALPIHSVHNLPSLVHANLLRLASASKIPLPSDQYYLCLIRPKWPESLLKDLTFGANGRIYFYILSQFNICVIKMDLDCTGQRSVNLDRGPLLHEIFWLWYKTDYASTSFAHHCLHLRQLLRRA